MARQCPVVTPPRALPKDPGRDPEELEVSVGSRVVADGLRQRRRQSTRDAIVSEALRLFRSRGFDATTVTDIAEGAGIARRTFFGYFAAKEAVAFVAMDEDIVELEDRLGSRAEGEDALDIWASWVLERHVRHTTPQEYARRELVRATPSLSAYERLRLGHIEELLVEALAEDLDAEPGAPGPRLAAASAAALLYTMGVAYDETSLDRRSAPKAPTAESMVGEAMAFLRAGLAALS